MIWASKSSILTRIKNIYNGSGIGFIQTKPPDLRGGTFVSFGPGRDVCQQRAEYAISINKLYQKYITMGNVCQFWGKPKTEKPTFLGK